MSPNIYHFPLVAATPLLYLTGCLPSSFEAPETLIRPVQVQRFEYHQSQKTHRTALRLNSG